mgnify:CR=1 FL=1
MSKENKQVQQVILKNVEVPLTAENLKKWRERVNANKDKKVGKEK